MSTVSDDTVALLRRVPVFSSLESDDLARVAEVAVPRRFPAGAVIFREGDDSDTCYVVRSGLARAVYEHPDGRSLTLANFGPGDIFGELAMFDDERRSATVDMLEDTELLGILGGDMRRLMGQHPTIAVKLITALAQRLRTMNERLVRQSFQTVPSRIAAVLLQMVEAAHPEEQLPGPELPHRDVVVRATQAELAQLAGSSRESASRALAALERAGIIEQGRGRLKINDMRGLEGYVF
jgi:CRP/FNR family transcriptional regulator, cyclic AMP receptor protein